MKRSNFSKVKEAAVAWNQVRQFISSGDQGDVVPVVIPRDKRGYTFFFWLGVAVYALLVMLFAALEGAFLWAGLSFLVALFFGVLGGINWWSSAVVEIDQGTMAIKSVWGKFEERPLPPGRQFLWWPWEKVEFIVNTSTEIPYTAPILSSPTKENVPLKSIEFFLRFKIENPVLFVRNIGAGNFDAVLSSSVQDAIRRRSREIETSQAYDLRGSNVEDMQRQLNEMMKRYGVRITGANIPDVQLPEQYQSNLATRERVAKEQISYEKEWDLLRKRRKDALELEIEQARKERDSFKVAVREAINKARQDVALMLQEKEAEAEKIKLQIEAQGNAELKSAENQAKATESLGQAYKDNRAVLQYELEMRRLEVAQQLIQHAPRPIVIKTPAGGQDSSLLSTMVMAQLLPDALKNSVSSRSYSSNPEPSTRQATQTAVSNAVQEAKAEMESMLSSLMSEVRKKK
jgi:regulator of protease activity HflC (stomatin/prohibitin superfamily)